MPRLGFAYRPFGDDKWAIRAGFGMYNINMLGSSFYSLTGTIQAYTQQFQNALNAATLSRPISGRKSTRAPAATVAPTATAPTTSAPPTAPTGKTPTRSSGR